MVDGGGMPFSVVYFDGETQVDVGEVTVDHSFNFNNFLSFLSNKIGISPHHFSVYLATLGTNRRIPITANVNFAAVARHNNATSFFIVKRSKRSRKNNNKSRNKHSPNPNNNKSMPENVMLLRRNAAVQPVLGRVEYEKRASDLQMERERYLNLMNLGIGDLCLGTGRESSKCEECLKGMDGGFHWCVYDAVTVGFRSMAGPVARPVRGSG